MRPLPALLALPLLLAGCMGPAQQLGPAASAGDDLAARVAALLGAALPCEAEVGAGTSANVAQVASEPLDDAGAVGTGEMWIHGDRAYVARYGTGGFSVVDLRDPLAPVELGAWDPEETRRGLDVKVLRDGSAALVGHDQGIAVVDVRDPRAMALEHVQAFERTQAHMLTTFTVRGQEYVAAAKGDGQDLPIFRVLGEPGAHTLEPVSSPGLTALPMRAGAWAPHDLLRTHDASFHEDPLLGKPLLWVANVWEGIVALDVSDPAAPVEVARIPNLKPQYTHTVQAAVLDGARRITVSVSEVGYNTLRVHDTTDLRSPVLLAEWDMGRPWQPQHNIQLVDPWLFVAHYTEGVYGFDLRRAIEGDMAPAMRLASDGDAREVTGGPTGMALGAAGVFGGVWDVAVKDGLLYLTDGGLRVASFGCLRPGDATLTSMG